MTDGTMKCQDCGKESDDLLDTQEWLVYEDIGGYKSIIGDDVRWKVVLCQQCTYDNLYHCIKTV